MSKNNHRKHLSLDERSTIASLLNQKAPIREIARVLNRPPSTISKEIHRNSKIYPSKQKNCKNYFSCKIKGLCQGCNLSCKQCSKCFSICTNFTPYVCKKKDSHPLKICNACHQFYNCHSDKTRYEATYAQKTNDERNHNSRSGFNLTDDEMETLNELVTPLILKGQSPYSILQSINDKISISESTLRRIIDACKLDARRIDLREAVKRKPRRKSPRGMKEFTPIQSKIGHTWEDYMELLKTTDISAVQMDCVEGLVTDKKAILTLHFPLPHLQLAFIMDSHTAKCVVDTLDLLEYSLGKQLFSELFEVILTDNGHEFTDIEGMESSIFGGKRTSIYFCERNRSDEKAECETNHKMIRDIIPKKTSIQKLVQPQITLMMNHINNYPRKSLLGKSPYDTARALMPKEFFDIIGLEKIPYDKVILKPSLLKQ